MDIIAILEKYSLTLRKLPDFVVHSYFLPEHPTEKELVNWQWDVISPISKKEFDFRLQKDQLKPHNSIFKNGYLVKKVVRIRIERKGGWLVKIDRGHNSMQLWSHKQDFYGKTPEEAVHAAVNYIDKRKIEQETLLKSLGLS